MAGLCHPGLDPGSILPKSEQKTIQVITNPKHKYQKFWSFILTRIVLSKILSVNTKDLVINRDRKPYLDSDYRQNGNICFPYFNVSHSGDLWAIAWSFSQEIGIDIQKIDPDINYKAIVRKFFPESSACQDRMNFYHLWTKLESAIKCDGKTIAHIKNVKLQNYNFSQINIPTQYVGYVAVSKS